MDQPRLSKLEMQVMDVVWGHGALTIRDIHARLSGKKPIAYTTVQTLVQRLEAKQALRRGEKTGNAFLFEATVSRNAAQRRLVDEFLGLFGGRMQPIMTHLIESGRLTLKDVQEAEETLKQMSKKRPKK
jgi:predicted transcriptional regulator